MLIPKESKNNKGESRCMEYERRKRSYLLLLPSSSSPPSSLYPFHSFHSQDNKSKWRITNGDWLNKAKEKIKGKYQQNKKEYPQ